MPSPVPETLRPPNTRPPHADPGEWARFRAGLIYTDTCWIWVRAVGGDGYGRFWATPGPSDQRATVVRPSRWMWQAHHGPIPTQLPGPGTGRPSILHACDTPLCARPECLSLGTQHDNLLDALGRDRVTHRSRLGRADKRGTLAASRALRDALLNAVAAGTADPGDLAALIAHVRATGDPHTNQLPLWSDTYA